MMAPARGPRPLNTLLEVTDSNARHLHSLARRLQWSESPERILAVTFAGERVPVDSRHQASVNRLNAVWPWIDALDATEMCASGMSRHEAAEALGYSVVQSLHNRTKAFARAAEAEAEREGLMAARHGRSEARTLVHEHS